MADRPDPRPNAWHPSSPAIDAESFEYVIEGPLTLVHFWAPWNPYDKTMDANLQAIQKDPAGIGNRFRFLAANTDQTALDPVVERFHVGALPTLLCFLNGKVVGRFHGVQTPEELKEFLTEMTQARSR